MNMLDKEEDNLIFMEIHLELNVFIVHQIIHHKLLILHNGDGLEMDLQFMDVISILHHKGIL